VTVCVFPAPVQCIDSPLDRSVAVRIFVRQGPEEEEEHDHDDGEEDNNEDDSEDGDSE
jgi:hypothetical protein